MKPLACLLAFSLLGSCHDRHVDVSDRVRSSRTVRVKDARDRVMVTTDQAAVIDQVASFMAQHADAWSGEDVFGTLPTSQLTVDFLNEKNELLVGGGIGDESLWIYPSKGVWRHLDRTERDSLLDFLGIQPESVAGFTPDERGRRTRR